MKEQRQDRLQQSQPSGSTTDNKNLNSELIKKTDYGMFKIIEIEQTGEIFTALGRLKIKSYESVDDAKNDIDKKDWELLITVITGLISFAEIIKEENKLRNKKTENQ